MAPPPPRVHTVVLVAGAALLAKRALHRRIAASPLWPLPALEPPVSGRGRHRTVGRRLLITERAPEADGVVRLRLESASGEPLDAWTPGAHLDLVLPSGLVRQYSLCGDPADREAYTVATRLIEDGRGGSREVHEQLHEGAEIEIRGPRNRFPLVEAASYVFVAGGIGITPVLPMLRAAEAAGARWRLVYCGRTRASMPFLAEAEKLGGGAGRVTVVPQDELGHPGLEFGDDPAGTAYYCCGPEGLLEAVTAALPAGAALHLERFAPQAADAADADSFDVELRRSGRTVTVAPGSTVLAAVRAEVANVPYSCEQGFCGTCQQRVIDGEIDHRDELLTDAERDDSMLICVSRARGGRLVLDL
ncbi:MULTISPECIES: PDR/VanB family oxidoreductase [unclassified Streptomyces]|uniref:PDR/VanB family oxidoreductase n=1 Tax=unclassified Streptomyces TaxID=2593676 RepID=UPI002E13A857|nr:PDR/VanB family oxidoreductase [Streptomyces sp. NBC_01197]WSS48709.1 PDR/VanB family oxidoreductase [Streptomyces sp. NBC_01180]